MAKALDSGEYFRKQDLANIVLLLGGQVQEKDTLSNLHDAIMILTENARPFGATGTSGATGSKESYPEKPYGATGTKKNPKKGNYPNREIMLKMAWAFGQPADESMALTPFARSSTRRSSR